MGQAFDREGNVLGEAFGNTKREVFDKLQKEHANAYELRIRSLMSAQGEIPSEAREKEVSQEIAAFEKSLAETINKHSMENVSNTPDFILGDFLGRCLAAFDEASLRREKWYDKELRIGTGLAPTVKSIEIASRIWCDQDMREIAMDCDAAKEIALIIDRVLKSRGENQLR